MKHADQYSEPSEDLPESILLNIDLDTSSLCLLLVILDVIALHVVVILEIDIWHVTHWNVVILVIVEGRRVTVSKVVLGAIKLRGQHK